MQHYMVSGVKTDAQFVWVQYTCKFLHIFNLELVKSTDVEPKDTEG